MSTLLIKPVWGKAVSSPSTSNRTTCSLCGNMFPIPGMFTITVRKKATKETVVNNLCSYCFRKLRNLGLFEEDMAEGTEMAVTRIVEV